MRSLVRQDAKSMILPNEKLVNSTSSKLKTSALLKTLLKEKASTRLREKYLQKAYLISLLFRIFFSKKTSYSAIIRKQTT